MREVEAAARAMGLQIQVLNANTSREIDTAFDGIARERPDRPLRHDHHFLERSAWSNWPCWLRSTGYPRHMICVNLPKPAG